MENPVIVLRIDPEAAARELAERAPEIEAIIEVLDEAKRTTGETMRIEFTV